jgi:hypothetical protein
VRSSFESRRLSGRTLRLLMRRYRKLLVVYMVSRSINGVVKDKTLFGQRTPPTHFEHVRLAKECSVTFSGPQERRASNSCAPKHSTSSLSTPHSSLSHCTLTSTFMPSDKELLEQIAKVAGNNQWPCLVGENPFTPLTPAC